MVNEQSDNQPSPPPYRQCLERGKGSVLDFCKGLRQRNDALINSDGSLKLPPSGSLLALPSST